MKSALVVTVLALGGCVTAAPPPTVPKTEPPGNGVVETAWDRMTDTTTVRYKQSLSQFEVLTAKFQFKGRDPGNAPAYGPVVLGYVVAHADDEWRHLGQRNVAALVDGYAMPVVGDWDGKTDRGGDGSLIFAEEITAKFHPATFKERFANFTNAELRFGSVQFVMAENGKAALRRFAQSLPSAPQPNVASTE